MLKGLLHLTKRVFAAPSARCALGAKPDVYDPRDFIKSTTAVSTPDVVDLSAYGRETPWNQGTVGACTGYSAAMLVANVFGRLNPDKLWDPAPLFLYYKAREFDGSVTVDAGATLRSMMKVLHQIGVAPLEAHPTLTDWRLEPSQAALDTAALLKIRDYQRIPVGPDAPVTMQRVLHWEMLPILVAVQIHENVYSREVAWKGEIPMPDGKSKTLGYHAMVVDGFDHRKGVFTGWNSWGKGWGWGGRFSLPFEYFTRVDLAADVWTFTPSYW